MPIPGGEVYLVDPGHEARWKRGWVAVVPRGKDHGEIRRTVPEDSLALRVDRSGECHLWTGPLDHKGYARFLAGGKSVGAHRYVYETEIGPIPDDLFVDHVCWNRHCVRADHLRLATVEENARNRRGADMRSRTGVRGVVRNSGAWVAQVKVRSQIIQERYKTIEEAAAAAPLLRRRYLGAEFAGGD